MLIEPDMPLLRQARPARPDFCFRIAESISGAETLFDRRHEFARDIHACQSRHDEHEKEHDGEHHEDVFEHALAGLGMPIFAQQKSRETP